MQFRAPAHHPLRGALRACAVLSTFLVFLCGFSVFTRLAMLFVSPFGEMRRLRFGQAVMHRFFKAAAWLFGIQITHEGPLPAPGSMVVANHHSYMDIVALGAMVPCFFLSKAEVSRWPLLGPGAAAAGIAFVKRDSPRSRKAALETLLRRVQAGFTVVNFPSGTTCRQGETVRFRTGLFRVIAGTPVCLVPTSLRYEDGAADWVGDATFVGHLVRLAAKPRLRVHVAFHRPLNARDSGGDALRDACEGLVNASISSSTKEG
ncbi:1-acylglycerol-3-phosphate O-acyltransferase [Stigmatella aurantiaca DW4/3-1]|uniref:1-acylglycerol-3-phosphate O-acyltransferase n=1 Tax=Stigmatella aurantiaca (strain DW4/3-1) TaxID=378806 RepID=E3FKR7_STIAD|nr:1-acylglycerol-3-phosphate O-acyltransferase [Stigmatella aurantiaca DW4/3-1]